MLLYNIAYKNPVFCISEDGFNILDSSIKVK